MINKPIAKTWTFQSNSNPNKTYETIQYADGDTSCNCRGWTFMRNGVRTCTHTRKVDQGTADREAVSVWNQQTVAPLPIQPAMRALPAADAIQLPKKKTKVKAKVEEPLARIVNWRD